MAGLSQAAAKGKGFHDQSQTPIPSFRPSPSVAFASELYFQKQVLRKKSNFTCFLPCFPEHFLLTFTTAVPGAVRCGVPVPRYTKEVPDKTPPNLDGSDDINSLEFYQFCRVSKELRTYRIPDPKALAIFGQGVEMC